MEYIVQAHKMKTNLAIVSAGQIKRLINSSKNFVLMMVKMKNDEVSKYFEGCDPKQKSELIEIISSMMICFKIRRGYHQRGRFSMRYICSRMCHFRT